MQVLEVDKHRPSSIKIRFPRDRDQHLSIVQPVRKSREKPDIPLEKALSEWEKGITVWDTMWVNLRYVVKVTSIKQGVAYSQ